MWNWVYGQYTFSILVVNGGLTPLTFHREYFALEIFDLGDDFQRIVYSQSHHHLGFHYSWVQEGSS